MSLDQFLLFSFENFIILKIITFFSSFRKMIVYVCIEFLVVILGIVI
jgi:hypothetical protein